MAAVKKTTKQNGYGEKQTVRIITVDKEKRRVECAMRDGAMIFAAIWETGTIFRWPEVGEIWTVRMDTGIWRLDQIVQSIITEHESEATPKTLAELPESDTRIIGKKVHANDIDAKDLTVNTVIATSGLYTDYGIVTSLPVTTVKGSICTFKVTTGIYWRLIYTGETTYPWVKVGGPPFRKVDIAGNRATTSMVYQTTGAPAITSPALKMESDIRFGANFMFLTAGADGQIGLFIGESEKVAGRLNEVSGGGVPIAIVGSNLTTTSAQVVALKYKMNFGAAEIQIAEMYLEIDPLRVG